MTLRQYLVTMVLATLMCWVAWGFVIVNVDPFTASRLSFLFFYASFFLGLLGTVSVLAFFVYRLIDRGSLPLFRYVQLSFRQALVISLFTTVLLYMQGKAWLSLWTGLLLLGLFVFFISLTLSLRRVS